MGLFLRGGKGRGKEGKGSIVTFCGILLFPGKEQRDNVRRGWGKAAVPIIVSRKI